MPKQPPALDLNVDLESGVVPISKVASSLAMLIKRARERSQPIIVTQKGYPTGVILDVELYSALRARAEAVGSLPLEEPEELSPATPEPEPEPPAAEPTPKARGGRRRKAEGDA
jgi:prevent-host-death family protein